jgi:hypothetical protein
VVVKWQFGVFKLEFEVRRRVAVTVHPSLAGGNSTWQTSESQFCNLLLLEIVVAQMLRRIISLVQCYKDQRKYIYSTETRRELGEHFSRLQMGATG